MNQQGIIVIIVIIGSSDLEWDLLINGHAIVFISQPLRYIQAHLQGKLVSITTEPITHTHTHEHTHTHKHIYIYIYIQPHTELSFDFCILLISNTKVLSLLLVKVKGKGKMC